MEFIIIYGLVLVMLTASSLKDKQKTMLALKKALNGFIKLLPSLIPLLILLGFILTFLGEEMIMSLLGNESGIIGIFIGLIIGSIAFMPGFVAFPIGATLIRAGAGYPQVAAFVASLMSVGFVSANVEIRYFGKKATIIRNVLGVVIAVVFSLVVWVVM